MKLNKTYALIINWFYLINIVLILYTLTLVINNNYL